ncbi:hypothetical protein GCM10009660_19230 [Catellatospora bangladeshensis]
MVPAPRGWAPGGQPAVWAIGRTDRFRVAVGGAGINGNGPLSAGRREGRRRSGPLWTGLRGNDPGGGLNGSVSQWDRTTGGGGPGGGPDDGVVAEFLSAQQVLDLT